MEGLRVASLASGRVGHQRKEHQHQGERQHWHDFEWVHHGPFSVGFRHMNASPRNRFNSDRPGGRQPQCSPRLWDRLFGTSTRSCRNAASRHNERKLAGMLMFRNVYDD